MDTKMNEEKYEKVSPSLSQYKPSKEAVAAGKREPYHLTYMRRMKEALAKAAAEEPAAGVAAERDRGGGERASMSKRELEVLNIMFATDEALTVTGIVMCLRGLTQSTVTAVIRNLLREGLVEVTGTIYSGKVLSRTYRPTHAAKDAVMQYFAAQYDLIRSVVTLEELMESIK